MGIQGVPFERDHSLSEVLAVIKKHDGKISYICKELGCSHDTAYSYMRRHPEAGEARLQAQREHLAKRLDVCETGLEILINKIHEDPNHAYKSIIYTLNNLGKDRGYDHAEARAAVATAEYQQELLDATRDPLNKPTPQQ